MHAPSARASFVAGIFVGGRASRFGGIAKGLLLAPSGEPIVLRTRRLVESLGGKCMLVGAHPAYGELGLPVLVDEPDAQGPLGGLIALLQEAHDRAVLALACDMPHLDEALLARLVDEVPSAPILAPRRWAPDKEGHLWEPLCARYDPVQVLPHARSLARRGRCSLQSLLEAAGAQPLALGPEEESWLEDWDTLPEELVRERKPV